MRYFAGFLGGIVVATLLLIFQQHLIAGERYSPPDPQPVIVLGSVTKPKPPEFKTYEPKPPPREPEPLVKPVNSIEPMRSEPVQPPRIPLASVPSLKGLGGGPYLERGVLRHGFDGGAAVKHAFEPRYPVDALRNGIEGEVEVEFTVLPDGSVTDVVVVRAEPRGVFERQARYAIERWQFIPRRENGVAVSMRARQVITFRLPHE